MNEEVTPRRLTRRELREKWMAEQAAAEQEAAAIEAEAGSLPDLSYIEAAPLVEQSEHALEPVSGAVATDTVLNDFVSADEWEEPAEDTQAALSRRRQGSTQETDEAIVEPAPTEPFSLADLQALQEESGLKDAAAAETDSAETGADTETESTSPVAKEKIEYSFPDIQPLAEEQPVFDEGSDRKVNDSKRDSADDSESKDGFRFEDVIERAVAEESTSIQSNTSALILPTFPEDELQGPLGATGELFVTGSFELPKSLSETGSHTAGFDNSREDDDEDVEISSAAAKEKTDESINGLFSDLETTEFDSAPKSARRAVSANSDHETVPTTPITKQDSKKPLIFGLIGGGLILAIIAGGIILYNTGMFG